MTDKIIIRSEKTKDLTPQQIEVLQAQVVEMNPLELKEFRNSHDPDSMGFSGEEAI